MLKWEPEGWRADTNPDGSFAALDIAPGKTSDFHELVRAATCNQLSTEERELLMRITCAIRPDLASGFIQRDIVLYAVPAIYEALLTSALWDLQRVSDYEDGR